MLLIAAGAVASGLVLVGCTAPVPNGGASAGNIANPDAVTSWAEKSSVKGVDWAACELPDTNDDTEAAQIDPSMVECAKIKVPVDWKDPDAGAVEVAALRVLPTGKLQGHIFVNPGGPGGSSTEEVLALGSTPETAQLREHHAFIGLDPRGVDGETGGTAPLCTAGAEECPPKETSAVAGHASTAEDAFDMDYARHLLGEKKLTYLGYSYGTYLGSIYATIFPGNVGKMVLDSAVSPDLGTARNFRMFSENKEDTVDRFLGTCLSGLLGPCPFTGTVQDAREQLVELRDRLNTSPVQPSDPATGTPIDGAALTFVMFSAGGGMMETWPARIATLAKLQAGTPTDLSAFTGHTGPVVATTADDRNNDPYVREILCAAPDATKPEKNAPATRVNALFADYVGKCSESGLPAWTDPAINYSGKNVLILNSTRDYATPLLGALELSKKLNQAHFTMVEADGHGMAFRARSACVDEQVTDFLIAGTTPTSTYCVAETP